MENMNKGLNVPKCVRIFSSFENTQNVPEFICQNFLDFNKEKASLGVRSPWTDVHPFEFE